MSFHPKAWVAWLAAAGTAVVAVDNPLATLVALAALVAVAAGFAARGPEGRSYAVLLKLGLAFLVVRVALFGLTGHAGDTTLATLPRVALPRWLGGLEVGGPLTAEVLAQSAAEGLRIAAFLACLGVFLSVVETYRVVRLLPRFLFEAGLIVSIAIAFVPAILRTAADVRDAQRLRGHRFRGLRSLRPLVVPVLASALERSLTLAASMETRGYGRRAGRAHRAEAAARAVALAGLVALAAGGALSLTRGGPVPLAVAALGGAGLAASLAAIARAVPRTRYRPERTDAWDRALIACSAAVAALAVAARALPAARWYAYPAVAMPAIDARVLAPAALLAAPVALALARAARLRRASAAHPTLATGAPP